MSEQNALVLVEPYTVDDSVFISSNVPESSYAAWNSASNYVVGDRVYLASTHKVYQSKTSNTNKNPSTSTDDWIVVGATNRWAAFDGSVSSQTTNPNSIVYELQFARPATWVQALNLTNANSMRVEVIDSGSVTIYDKTINLRPLPSTVGWWQWFFGQRYFKNEVSFDDLPVNPDTKIRITITGGSQLGVGVLIFGQPQYFTLGVQMGAGVGIQDYSRKERNEFGDIVVVPRAFAKRANFNMLANASEVDVIMRVFSRIRATPCLWVGSERYEATTIYGFWKNFDILIDYPEYSVLQLELEGLT